MGSNAIYKTIIITDVINIYGYEDDLMCWNHLEIEYSCISEGIIEVLVPDEELLEVSFSILDSGILQILDSEGDLISLESLNEIPDFAICDNNFTGEGCEDVQGQFMYSIPNTNSDMLIEVDGAGIDVFMPEGEDCVSYM